MASPRLVRIVIIAFVALLTATFLLGLRSQTTEAYQESPEGLQRLLNDLFVSQENGDTGKTTQFFDHFSIPSHKQWFENAFGATEGARLDAKYAELQPTSINWLRKRVEKAVSDGKVQIDVSLLQKPSDTTMPLLKAVTTAMTSPTAIYLTTDRMNADDKSPFYLGYFVYVDGGFRYLDQQVLQALSTAPLSRVRMGGKIMEINLTKKVEPVYPKLARENGIRGMVSLTIIVGTDGTVSQVQVLGGDPALQMAAVDAVRQWRYRPIFLNGKPVEVETRVDVNFQ